MKKIICLLLILSFTLSFVSCNLIFGGKNSINGEMLRDYSIVYSDEDSDYSKRAAEYIQREILARTRINLPIVEDSEDPKTENEIVVGETARDISKKLNADTERLQFSIMADGGDVALEGEYFIIAAAAYFFIETYIPEKDFDATVPEEACVHSPIVKEAKNFILLIGDGMGINHTKMFE